MPWKIIATPKGDILHTQFRGQADWVTATSFSPDGLLVAAGDRFGGLFLWETRSGAEFLPVKGHPKTITAIAWSKNRDELLTASEDSAAIQGIDLNTGKVIRRWEAHSGWRASRSTCILQDGSRRVVEIVG